jgi:hypothetical protein
VNINSSYCLGASWSVFLQLVIDLSFALVFVICFDVLNILAVELYLHRYFKILLVKDMCIFLVSCNPCTIQ